MARGTILLSVPWWKHNTLPSCERETGPQELQVWGQHPEQESPMLCFWGAFLSFLKSHGCCLGSILQRLKPQAAAHSWSWNKPKKTDLVIMHQVTDERVEVREQLTHQCRSTVKRAIDSIGRLCPSLQHFEFFSYALSCQLSPIYFTGFCCTHIISFIYPNKYEGHTPIPNL